MNFFHKIFHLCAGFANYRDVLDVPLAASLKHLVLLIAILAVALTGALIPWALELTDTAAHQLDKQLPPFAIHDGKITTTVPQPYRSGDADFLFILDTTGKVNEPDPVAAQGLLLTADHLVFWIKATNAPNAAIQSQRHSLRGFPDGAVNGDYFRRLVHAFLWVGAPLFALIITATGVAAAFVQAWLFAFAASFLERSMPTALGFRQLLNLAIHAVTPAAIIFTVYAACRLKDVDLWLVYLIAYGIFLIGAANACRRPVLPEEARDEEPF